MTGRFLKHRFRIPEIAIGALLATAFWAVVALSPAVNRATDQKSQQHAQYRSESVAIEKPIWADPNWFIALFSLCLVVVAAYQYRALKKANAAAESAAKAAESAVLSSRHQLRAYVHVEKVDVDGTVGGTKPPAFKIRFKNFGQTPAHRVSHRCNMCLTFEGNEPRIQNPKRHRYADLGPSQGRTTILFTDDDIWELERFSAGSGNLYLVGEITYLDAFQVLETNAVPRYTQYRYLVQVTKSGSVLLSGAEGGNDSS